MPFKSQAQRGFLFANHPDIAKKWAAEYGNGLSTPKIPRMKLSQLAKVAKSKGESKWAKK